MDDIQIAGEGEQLLLGVPENIGEFRVRVFEAPMLDDCHAGKRELYQRSILLLGFPERRLPRPALGQVSQLVEQGRMAVEVDTS